MPHLNWLAVLAAALSTFVLGGLWYSKALFGRAWMEVNGLTDADLAKSNMLKIFGLSLVFAVIMAANLAAFLTEPKTTAVWGATAGFLAGFGWVALAIATIALFERRPWKYPDQRRLYDRFVRDYGTHHRGVALNAVGVKCNRGRAHTSRLPVTAPRKISSCPLCRTILSSSPYLPSPWTTSFHPPTSRR